jgi:DNA polymerase-1
LRVARAALARWYRRVWCLDFEYHQPKGHRPDPICMSAIDILSGEKIELWFEDEGSRKCPFACDSRELFVSYYAVAEASIFLALKWPRPLRVLDLFVEFRNLRNGVRPSTGFKLNGALAFYGLRLVSKEVVELAIRGKPFAPQERTLLQEYCADDRDALVRLLEPIFLEANLTDPLCLGRALLHGREMAAFAQVEANGIPVDVEAFTPTSVHMPKIVAKFTAAVDKDYGVYEDGAFSAALFGQYLIDKKIAWPKLKSGRLALDDETFKRKAEEYPELLPLHKLRTTLGKVRLHKLTLGSDARNRVMLSPFQSITGRGQPSSAEFLYGPASWVRCFIKAPDGRALAYCDYASQEIAIAAVLSGDANLWADYATGDVYVAFAIEAGLLKPNADKGAVKAIRDQCKPLFLSINYGATAQGLATRARLPLETAVDLMRRHRLRYPDFWRWSDDMVNRALLGMPLETVLGWRMQWPPGCGIGRKKNPGDPNIMKGRTARNFLMQASGSEMLRLAVTMACEAGIMVIAPVHDAVAIEAADANIDGEVAHLHKIMLDASEIVLGRRIRVGNPEIVRSGQRYVDSRGNALYEQIRAELDKLLLEGGT